MWACREVSTHGKQPWKQSTIQQMKVISQLFERSVQSKIIMVIPGVLLYARSATSQQSHSGFKGLLSSVQKTSHMLEHISRKQNGTRF